MNGFRQLSSILLLSISLLVATGSGGCATVSPPKQRPVDPVDVFITDYGVHSSLILPVDNDGLYVEYAFGDFGYAALNNDGLHDAVGALLFSFGSGFGRQYLRVPPGGDTPVLMYFPKRMSRLVASRASVKEVLADMDARYDGNAGSITYNEITRIDWKRDKQHYSLFSSCNHMTAAQLKKLGYQVHGPALFSGFNVRGSQPVDPKAIKDESKDAGGMSGSR